MFLFILGLVLFFIGNAAKPNTGGLSRFRTILRLGGLAVMVIGGLTAAVRQVPAGHVGVQILFGKVEEQVLYEGLNFVNPLMTVKEIEVRTQNYTMSVVHDEGQQAGDDGIRVLSKDGLEVAIDLTVLYRIDPQYAPRIYRDLNLDYENRYIRGVARTRIREGATGYVATDLYSAHRKEFENSIRTLVDADFAKKGFILDQLLIRNIALPASVKESIERKINAEQDAQRMEYVLDKGRREAELKRVEAQGIADAQKILSEGLNEKVLQFETIKVQKELVNSPNSKIIILGGGKSTTPIILDGK
ncbi:MAG: prohibitin family protein [Bacteroidetes bacterium]|nr:prohibitin family protein [Bacteroidota bacterium]